MTDVWRAPVEADKQRVCRAKNAYEDKEFSVEWNPEYECWAAAGYPHILVSVYQVKDTTLRR